MTVDQKSILALVVLILALIAYVAVLIFEEKWK